MSEEGLRGRKITKRDSTSRRASTSRGKPRPQSPQEGNAPRVANGRRRREAPSATRARFGRGRRTIRKGRTQESSSDTRTTATLRGHGQSARETSSTNGEGHASIAPVSGAPLAWLTDHEDSATRFFDPGRKDLVVGLGFVVRVK